MSPRELGTRSDTAVNLSGPLSDSLRRHAVDRAVHFFRYLFAMRVLVSHLRALHGIALKAAEGVEVKATDQIDTGFRRQRGYQRFERGDANTIDLDTSAFGLMDAAHFCNLGIQPKFVRKIAPFIRLGHPDPIPFRFYELLKKICGNTQLLPQSVNIGPDRIVDVMHGELAIEMLESPTRVLSRSTVARYQGEAKSRMTRYQDAAFEAGEMGIAACAACYLAAYEDAFVITQKERRALHLQHARALRALRPGERAPPAPEITPLSFADAVYGTAADNVRGECLAFTALNLTEHLE
jgi:hypothetical protein